MLPAAFMPRETKSVGHIITLKAGTVGTASNLSAAIGRRRNLIVQTVFNDAVRGFSVPPMPDDRVLALLQQEGSFIESIEPDYTAEAYAQDVPWGVRRVGATANTSTAAINNAGPNTSTHIFVLDTGVSLHPDLNVVEALSFVPTETSTLDLNGHGTSVAGCAAARDNTVGVVGIAPGAPIHSYKCLGANGSGAFSSIIAALDRVITWKLANPTALAVVNMSLGGYVGTFAYNSLDIAVKKLSVTYGIPVVVAAGNSGDMAGLYSPAHAVEAITVGAYDSTNNMTPWSNWGTYVDLLAPGSNVVTTSYEPKRKRYGYTTVNGTSFSAPYLAGAVALMLATTPSATPAEVVAALKTKAEDAVSAGTNPLVGSTFPDTTRISMFVALV